MELNSTKELVAPIIILSAPRAGSTLLFELLSKHPELWTIGGESHATIEHLPQLSTVARGYVSNCLDELDASEETIHQLRLRFMHSAKNSQSLSHANFKGECFRLLEKTPKNALRVAFLNRVFPDAKFIFLLRDPRENISSIMEAWRSKRFITYPDLPSYKGSWSLLLPDGWRDYINSSLSCVARFQWKAANDAILRDLNKVDSGRKMILGYADFIANPEGSLENILKFAGLNLDSASKMVGTGLPLSRYTLTKPQKNKWYTNAFDLSSEMPEIEDTVFALNLCLKDVNGLMLSTHIDLFEINALRENQLSLVSRPEPVARVSRNASCPCGSGKKYKQCHGQLV